MQYPKSVIDSHLLFLYYAISIYVNNTINQYETSMLMFYLLPVCWHRSQGGTNVWGYQAPATSLLELEDKFCFNRKEIDNQLTFPTQDILQHVLYKSRTMGWLFKLWKIVVQGFMWMCILETGTFLSLKHPKTVKLKQPPEVGFIQCL